MERIIADDLWRGKLKWDELGDRFHPPLSVSEIPRFRHWLHFNDFKKPNPRHFGTDFAAFQDDLGLKNFGLYPCTVYAVLPGVIFYKHHDQVISDMVAKDIESSQNYYNEVGILHSEDRIIASAYGHICPDIELGRWVEAGTPIGRLYRYDNCDFGLLVHLHLKLGTARMTETNYCLEALAKDNFNQFNVECQQDAFSLLPSIQIGGNLSLPVPRDRYEREELFQQGIRLNNHRTVLVALNYSY